MAMVTGVFIFLFGLVIGSFLNVCIYRLPIGESIVVGRSHCPACGNKIENRDLIPVLSFLWLHGRCRSCRARISARYPLVELGNALLWLALYIPFGFTPDFLIYAAFSSLILVAALIDLDHTVIPNGVILLIFAVGIAAAVLSRKLTVADRIIGLFALSAPLLAAALLSRGGMGLGDVKFAAAAGVVLGWKAMLLSLVFSSVTAAIFGMIDIKCRHATLKTAIPFGPFLAGAFLLSVFFGDRILSAYLSLFI